METAMAPVIETVRDYDVKLFNHWDFDVGAWKLLWLPL
ncbi:hypothetical protein SLEP1_g54369 [Rubroshorea leprosula]|uniref:Uncharacterized protein n=1 Tax=Rubroshorea leprosula TaxID=152421 RepID=A0AAV5MC58_9ROSI|nr:hypothetical protein SLEP1_g54369 [Rubroshorea leprosula]